jgi:predicted AlkP superfamily phosphohydrolase/phosphomutase
MVSRPKRLITALCVLVLGSWAPPQTARAQTPTRAIIFAWDGVVPSFLNRLLNQGKLPNLAKLIAGGAFADEVVAVYPSKTAPGFASLWTGAPPRITAISGNRQPRMPAHQYTILDSELSFLSVPLRAEPLWATALRAGRKVTLAHVPLGRELSEGAIKLLGYDGYAGRDGVVNSRLAAAQPATTWANLPPSIKPAMEFQFTIAGSAFFGLFIDDPVDERVGYDTLLVTASRDAAKELVRLKTHAANQDSDLWRGPIEVKTVAGESANVYLRLFDLDADANDFLLFYTRPVRNMIFPAELGATVNAAAGAFVGNGARLLYQEGALGPTFGAAGSGAAEARYLETVRMAQHQIKQTALWAIQRVSWDLLFLYTPFPDEGEHLLRGYVDPATNKDPTLAAAAVRLLEEIYKSCDDLLGAVLANRPENTLIAVVSDHGMEGVNKTLAVNRVLEREGLLVLNEKGVPDLTRTRAFYPPVNNGYILINSTSRKGGIVTQQEWPAVVERLRSALLGIRDDGRAVVTAVYDAQQEGEKMGIGGEAGGDVYLDILPNYDFDARLGSGEIITTREPYGMHGFNPARASMRTVMVLAGPGIAAGKRIKDIRVIDFAPTIAKHLGLPVPKDAAGRVVEEAFVNAR